MEANAAGAVQEAHCGVVWRSRPGFRAASHPCSPRLSVGIPLQTMTILQCTFLTVLFLITRRQFGLSIGKLEGLVKPAHHMLEGKSSFYHHVQAVSAWTASVHDISTNLTSRDSTPSFSWKKHLLGWRHVKLENAALRKNYKHSGAFRELVGSPPADPPGIRGSVVSLRDCGRTSAEWTFRNLEAWWRTQLKQSVIPVGFIFVAAFNTLMLFNVYIARECSTALMAQTPLDDLFLNHRARKFSPDETSVVKLYCIQRCLLHLVQLSLPGRFVITDLEK